MRRTKVYVYFIAGWLGMYYALIFGGAFGILPVGVFAYIAVIWYLDRRAELKNLDQELADLLSKR